MNWPSARSSRASGPRSTVKRDAGELGGGWRSPSCRAPRPSSKCCREPAAMRGGGADPLFLDIGGLVSAVGHVRVEDVGEGCEPGRRSPPRRRLRALRGWPWRRAGLAASALSAAESLPARLEGADLLGERIAPGLTAPRGRSGRPGVRCRWRRMSVAATGEQVAAEPWHGRTAQRRREWPGYRAFVVHRACPGWHLAIHGVQQHRRDAYGPVEQSGSSSDV